MRRGQEGEALRGVADLGGEGGEASGHVRAQQAVAGLVRRGDRHVVVAAGGAEVVHVPVQPPGEAGDLAQGGGEADAGIDVDRRGDGSSGHAEVGEDSLGEVAGWHGPVEPPLGGGDQSESLRRPGGGHGGDREEGRDDDTPGTSQEVTAVHRWLRHTVVWPAQTEELRRDVEHLSDPPIGSGPEPFEPAG